MYYYNMLSSSEKIIILSTGVFCSGFLFSNSLHAFNYMMLNHNGHYNNHHLYTLFMVNKFNMLFSISAFSYFTYIAIK
jgi:hypothetical protein